jgi:prepilin-type N-terminal cleavage/methylation domain-containing protein
MKARRSRRGFTLLEMLAVVVLMAIVLGVAIDFYLDLSHASFAATTQTGASRRAMVLLDRVARDLEGAVLLQKPPEVDPLAFPWLFVAEAESSDAGADRVKFVRRGHVPRSSDLAESDLEVVAWITDTGPDGAIELRRAAWPQLPERLDRSFPDADQSDLVIGGLASFGIRFQGDSGDWTGRWDSTTIEESSALPVSAEIEVSFATGEQGVVDGPYTRKVLFPLRPLDLADKLKQAEGEQQAGVVVKDEDGDGDIDETDQQIAQQKAESEKNGGAANGDVGSNLTLADCMGRDPSVAAQVENLMKSDQGLAAAIQSMMSLPVAQAAQAAGVAIPATCQ